MRTPLIKSLRHDWSLVFYILVSKIGMIKIYILCYTLFK